MKFLQCAYADVTMLPQPAQKLSVRVNQMADPAAGRDRLAKLLEDSMECVLGMLMPMQSSEQAADRALAETVITKTMSQYITGEFADCCIVAIIMLLLFPSAAAAAVITNKLQAAPLTGCSFHIDAQRDEALQRSLIKTIGRCLLTSSEAAVITAPCFSITAVVTAIRKLTRQSGSNSAQAEHILWTQV